MTRAGQLASSVLVLAIATVPASADRLHLVNGGSIDVDHWRIEGETLVYENDEGSIGVPRSLVARIEPTGGETLRTDRPRTVAAAPTTSAPAPVAASETDGPGTIRVTRAIAETMSAARTALTARDFRQAADLYAAALRDGPDELQPARVGYAMAQIALGEDALALGVVIDGLAREPSHPELLELFGDLRDREERVEDALAAWRQAQHARGDQPLDRLEQKIQRASRELAAGRDYALSASSHFTLRHDGEIDRALTRAVLDHLESEFWRVSRDLDHTAHQPITVLLYPEQAFREVTGAESWVGGLYDGKIRVPLGGLRRLGPAARRVLTHELTHAVLHSKTRGNCPRWLHEGLAQRAEGRRLGAGERQGLATLLSSVEPADWEAPGFSYPAALSLTEFVADYWGETSLLRLLNRLGDGVALESALREIYGESYESLCRRWSRAVLSGEGR